MSRQADRHADRQADRQTGGQTTYVPSHIEPLEVDRNPGLHTHSAPIFTDQIPLCEHINLGPTPLSGCAFSTHCPTT